MKLYLSPGACSLADHIALHEAGLAFDHVRVDLRTKRTEDGRDFHEVNPKGYVPALVLNDGQLLTENVAILFWIAEQAPRLAPGGSLGRTRLIEMLAFIGSELHKPFVRSLRSRPPRTPSASGLPSSPSGCKAITCSATR
jgi:glutathione S-transferase